MISDQITVSSNSSVISKKIRQFMVRVQALNANCKIELTNNKTGKTADVYKINEMVGLSIDTGTVLIFSCDGDDEVEILAKIMEIARATDNE